MKFRIFVSVMKKFFALFPLFSVFLALSLPAQDFRVTAIRAHRIEVTQALDTAPADSISALLAPYRKTVDSITAPVIGHSLVAMSPGRPESTLSNWATDAVQSITREVFGMASDFTLLNIGALRANMPQGDVTVGDMMLIVPFSSTLVMMDLSGAEVIRLMNDIAAVGGEGVSREVHMHITADGRADSITISGMAVDSHRTYRIATIDYMLAGNDRIYTMAKGSNIRTTHITLHDALCGILAKGSITSSLDGRITSDYHVAPEGEKVRSLFVVHTNDTHSCIEPISRNDADTAQAFKGGYVRRAALVQQLRQAHPDLLLLDAGDFSQGSPYYSLFGGEVEVRLMNAMHYEAATIGNHEFDFGMENMARIFRMAQFPIVCCNYDFTGTPVEGLVQPYTVVHHAGLRIGVFGVSPQLEGLVDAHSCQGTRYVQPAVAAQPVIDHLRDALHCDVVICLSHLGWGTDPGMDPDFISSTHGIDLVIGGHTHTYMEEPVFVPDLDGKPVLVNQMGKNARYVGTIELDF